MAFNRKLLLAGLAVGITAYTLYKLSKKREKEKIAAGQHYQWNPSKLMIGGGAAAAAGGLAAASMSHHHQQQQQQNHPEHDVMWAALRDPNHIADILSACVTDQHLYPFYDYNRIHHLAKRLAQTGAVQECCEAWQLPPNLGQDLAKLALFDISFLLDDSMSMQSEGHLRRDALKAILERAADAGSRFDADGMEVQWMNGQKHSLNRLRKPLDAAEIVSKCKWDGRATPMGASLERMLTANVLSRAENNALEKPALIIIITDGRPTGHGEHDNKILRVIQHVKDRLSQTRYGPDAISVSICAVGNDQEAQQWLDSIDSDPKVGGLVDVTSDRRVEAQQVKRACGVDLTEELHCLKVLLGGIDSTYDNSDESKPPSGQMRQAARKRSASLNRGKMESFEAERYHARHQEAYRLGLPAPPKPPFVRDAPEYPSKGAPLYNAPPQQSFYSQGPQQASYSQPPQSYDQQQQQQQPPYGQASSQPYGQPASQPYGQYGEVPQYGQTAAMPPSQYGQYGQPSYVPPPQDYNNSSYPSSQPAYMNQPSMGFPDTQSSYLPPYTNQQSSQFDSSVGGFMMPAPNLPSSTNSYGQGQDGNEHINFPSAFPS